MLILSFCTFMGAKVVKKEQISKGLFHKLTPIVQSIAFGYAEKVSDNHDGLTILPISRGLHIVSFAEL